MARHRSGRPHRRGSRRLAATVVSALVMAMGTVTAGAAAADDGTCTVQATGGNVQLEWASSEPAKRIHIRRDNRWITGLPGDATSWSGTNQPADADWVVRVNPVNGPRFDHNCVSGNTPSPPVDAPARCIILPSTGAGSHDLSFPDVEADRFIVRRLMDDGNDRWVAGFDGAATGGSVSAGPGHLYLRVRPPTGAPYDLPCVTRQGEVAEYLITTDGPLCASDGMNLLAFNTEGARVALRNSDGWVLNGADKVHLVFNIDDAEVEDHFIRVRDGNGTHDHQCELNGATRSEFYTYPEALGIPSDLAALTEDDFATTNGPHTVTYVQQGTYNVVLIENTDTGDRRYFDAIDTPNIQVTADGRYLSGSYELDTPEVFDTATGSSAIAPWHAAG